MQSFQVDLIPGTKSQLFVAQNGTSVDQAVPLAVLKFGLNQT